MSTYVYGMRFDDDSNAITVIDEENQTAATTGYINGEPVDFSGGGGSSDFSTAEVTIVNSVPNHLSVPIPQCVEENSLGPGSPAMIYSYVDITASTAKTIKAPLYKGSLYLMNINATDASGDATLTDGDVLVTGDCTITIS